MISRRTLLGAGTAALGVVGLPVSPVFAGTVGRTVPWGRLGQQLQGRLVLPSDAAYSTAKQLELMQFDAVNPQAVAYCAGSADVSLAVRFAQDHGLPAAVRSGGHSYGGYSTSTGLVIDVSGLNAVAVGASTVRIGPGAQNVDILNTLAGYGLVVSEGGCPTVASGGFLQGGGFGFLTRPLGMACDALVSAEVVLADGTVVTASADQDRDLFWALRGGGGGNFGVVTSYTVTPHAIGAMPTTNLFFSFDNAAQVFDGFTHWLVDAPRTLGGGTYAVLNDAAPGAAPTVMTTLTSTGSASELAAEVSRLLSCTGAPLSQQSAALSYRDLMMTVFGCGSLSPEQCHRSDTSEGGTLARPAYGLERSRLCDGPLPATAWGEVAAAFDADRTTGHFRQLEIHMFGGAANDPGRTDTAYVHRDALYCVNYRDTIADPAAADAAGRAGAKAWVDGGFAVIDPYSSGESYQNWMDPELRDWKRSYYAENYPRLLSLKAGYDPHRFFSFAQGVGAP
ncbi:FAD-dependent oxidoreductase [Streptacidiphilus sp. PAMC 29251]